MENKVMENKINIAELLKDCPQGMELDCTMFEDIEFDSIVDDKYCPIRCRIKHSDGGYNIHNFTKYGCWNDTYKAKCVIFPKGKTTWKGFIPPNKFKDGDIISVITKYNHWCAIYQKEFNSIIYSYATYLIKTQSLHIDNKTLCDIKAIIEIRFATEEEKQKLFDAIKDNGYRWNPETKTLEELLNFKIGDIIYNTIDINNKVKIIGIADKYYICENNFKLYFKFQEYWRLVQDKFDINTLVPFEDKVLVRNDENQIWLPAFWGYKVVDGFITTFGWSKYCIPYKGNEHLFKTNNDCDKIFKVWENEQ